ncbi:MAG: hypothetical protein Q9157_004082 [Trypethelium eluteriae]
MSYYSFKIGPRVTWTTVCDICGIDGNSSQQTKLYAGGQYSAEVVPPGSVQLRHFDGTSYFWDIGDHLFLRDCKTSDADLKYPKARPKDSSNTIPLEDIVLPNADSKQAMLSFYKGLSPDYLSGDIVIEPLQTWQDNDRTATLFEKRNSIRPQIRRTQSEACLNCGCLKEHKALWTEQNRSIIQLSHRTGFDTWFWSIGSKAFMKDLTYDNVESGGEEAAVDFVREHTTIPVPAWIRSWHEGHRAITLMGQLPGQDYAAAVNELDEENKPKLTKEERKVIEQEVAGYVKQLRALTSPQAGTADGRLLPNFSFRTLDLESHWPLLPTHEEAKEDWYNKSLSGVSQEDLPELNRLKETFPSSEPYTFTHSFLVQENVMVHEKHVSGFSNWPFAGFAPVWSELMQCTFFSLYDVLDYDESTVGWIRAWKEIYNPNWMRTLKLSRQFRNGPEPNNPCCSIEELERLNQLPIGPPLPPNPLTMKDKRAPRHHLDEAGIWQQRERLTPMLELPEFDVSRCHIQ